MRSSKSAKQALRSSCTIFPSQCQFLHHRPRLQIAGAKLFSSSPTYHRRRPQHMSISNEEMQRIVRERLQNYKPYTEAEKKELTRKYTPEQLEAIELGEKAVATEDLATQARTRSDPLAFQYLDDFSTIDNVVDKRLSRLRGEGDNYEDVTDFAQVENPNEKLERIGEALLERDPDEPLDRFDTLWDQAMNDMKTVPANPEVERTLLQGDKLDMNERETEDFLNSVSSSQQPYNPADESSQSFSDTLNQSKQPASQDAFQLSAHKKLQDIISWDSSASPSSVAPTLPRINDPSVHWGPEPSDDADEETTAMYSLLSKQTGYTLEQIRRFRVKNLVAHRVVNQTRLGKIQSMYFLTIAGNQNGLLGVGEGKATEAEDARRAAMIAAIRNMRPVRRYEARTVYGTVRGKVGAVELELRARPPGFGLRCQHLIFEMARAAGIADLSGKVLRNRNKMNVAKATFAALMTQRDPEEVARARGRKLVDVRKVYYAGEV